MFKKRNRSGANRNIRKSEESSEEESLPPIRSVATKSTGIGQSHEPTNEDNNIVFFWIVIYS